MNLNAIPRERLLALLRAMPKAELHIHIERALGPELTFVLAQRNGVALAYPSVEALEMRGDRPLTQLRSALREPDFCPTLRDLWQDAKCTEQYKNHPP